MLINGTVEPFVRDRKMKNFNKTSTNLVNKPLHKIFKKLYYGKDNIYY